MQKFTLVLSLLLLATSQRYTHAMEKETNAGNQQQTLANLASRSDLALKKIAQASSSLEAFQEKQRQRHRAGLHAFLEFQEEQELAAAELLLGQIIAKKYYDETITQFRDSEDFAEEE